MGSARNSSVWRGLRPWVSLGGRDLGTTMASSAQFPSTHTWARWTQRCPESAGVVTLPGAVWLPVQGLPWGRADTWPAVASLRSSWGGSAEVHTDILPVRFQPCLPPGAQPDLSPHSGPNPP